MRRAGLAAAALAAVTLGATPALATPPGLNGGFAYQGGSGVGNVWSMTASGTSNTRLTFDAAEEGDAAWSPDGTRIAFTSRRDGGNPEIYVMNADGSNQVRFTIDASSDQQPTWSPDGTRIAWSSDRDSNFDIFSARLDGSDLRQHTLNGAFPDTNPAWSPDGSAIAFRSNRTGNGDIYRVSPAGTEVDVRRITSDDAQDDNPVWSPDGSRIAFDSSRTGAGDIYSASSAGAGPEVGVQRHTSAPQGDEGPAWSPDGTRIAFSTFRNTADWNIWTVGSSGTETAPLQLTSSVVSERQPAWQTLAPAPVLAAIAPGAVQAGSGPITLTVDGSGFTLRSRVLWHGQERNTTFVSQGRLTAAIPASDLASPGSVNVQVVTGPAGGGTSGALTFSVTPAPPPPGLSLSRATLQNRWRASRLRGRLILGGSASRPARLRVQVLRASGRGRALVTRTVTLSAAGAFTRRLALKPTLLPGRYLVRATEVGSGPGLLPAAERRTKLGAPREGVVARAFFSTKINGRPLRRITGRSIVFAHFRFAARPKPGRRLTVSWYAPGARRPVAVDRKAASRLVIAFIKARGPLPRGAWRATLRYGRTTVATARVRLR